jgi:hypothetical protein
MLHAVFLLTATVQSQIARSSKSKEKDLFNRVVQLDSHTNESTISIVIFEISFQFGFGTFAAYLIGIASAVFNVRFPSCYYISDYWGNTNALLWHHRYPFIEQYRCHP